MSRRGRPANLAASVRARLLDLARRRGDEFQLVLSEIATERLLYRLGVSPHADRFVLKGAMLLRLWSSARHRATWDLDLLGRGVDSVGAVSAAVRDLCAVVEDDGLVLDAGSISASETSQRRGAPAPGSGWRPTWPERESRCRSTSASMTPSFPRPVVRPTRRCSTTRRRGSSRILVKRSWRRNSRRW
jgi:hypothetical protein